MPGCVLDSRAGTATMVTGLRNSLKRMEHKDLVREEFTRQANDYASAPAIRDAEHLRQLVELVAPPADSRVLEVATGPGHVAMAFAQVCREVVGIDLTDAPLKIAERMRTERGITNLSFQKGDVESRLPFNDREFDVVVCRFAVHHFAEPRKVIAEMARVCRADGLIAIEDLIASEQPERAAYYNQFERLRDTSHTSALAMSELVRMMGAAGLEMLRFKSHGYRVAVSQWLKTAHTSPERAAKAIAMVERDAAEDLSGARPVRIDGEMYFTYRIAMLVTRKLA
jgi:ubiquinone/menaquinone biosynthesis C-methylase UbiE